MLSATIQGNNPIADSIAKAWAKANAIKAGDFLKQEEMAQLMTLLLQTNEPMVSPFGKPTLMRLTADELQKKFRN
jgi:DNA mismatch repair protein MutL